MKTKIIGIAAFVILAGTAGELLADDQLVYDFIIRGATVYDGESLEGRAVDIGLIADQIRAVGDLSHAEAFEVVDAKAWVAAPGFIDAHTHSDFNPLIYPDLPNKIEQGVTTEIVGNCGMSAAPISGYHRGYIRTVWSREGVQIGENPEWTSFAEYRDRLKAAGMMTNFAGLIGHGNVRSAVMGLSPRPASQGDLEAMKEWIRRSMSEGAFGLSFGLVYLPGMFADENEITELCREAARASGICSFHLRSEGGALPEAVEEALQVARKARASIQISHLKAGGGKKNFPKIDEAFRLIESARIEGINIEADAYPYTAGFAELGVILPDAIFTREDRVELFRNPLKRDELLNELRKYYENRQMKWDWVWVASTPDERYRGYEGRSIKDIAVQEDIEPEKLLIELLGDTGFEVSAFFFSQSQEVVDRVLAKSYVSIGSDSIADGSRRPHPRAFGTFPKILGEYVRTKNAFSLGEAIHKMTYLPARHFRIPKRGLIREGYYADLVIFDPARVADRADYENPGRSPEHIKWVFLNGTPVVRNARFMGTKAGRFLTGGVTGSAG